MESNMDSNTPKRQRTAPALLPNGLQPMLVRIDQAATIIGTSRRSIYHLQSTPGGEGRSQHADCL